MPILTHFAGPCPESINSQILQLVVDNVTDISAVNIAPSNPLYNLYQYTLGYEVHLYLEALNGTKGVAVELIVVTDDADVDKVLGFLLYLPVNDDPDACGVAFMAVHAGHRRQKIARLMLQDMLSRYPHAELTCTAARAPWFEAMGLQVVGARGPHVVMNSRDYSSHAVMGLLDVSGIYTSTEVRQIHTYLLQRQGKKAMVEAEKQRDRHLDQLTARAREFARQRLE